ncbi:MAG: aspartyl-phosphate phosphatase Spo0E family protein [Lachnospiraceae bacterium]|nr:aspartyl-phosphate phosphatase Spo0E family protein [Lachnospiraceae bacterium]
MEISRKELVTQIEHARNRLNQSIETGAAYETIYQNSIELDHLISQYIASNL